MTGHGRRWKVAVLVALLVVGGGVVGVGIGGAAGTVDGDGPDSSVGSIDARAGDPGADGTTPYAPQQLLVTLLLVGVLLGSGVATAATAVTAVTVTSTASPDVVTRRVAGGRRRARRER